MAEQDKKDTFDLSMQEQLLRHQLNIMQYWQGKVGKSPAESPDKKESEAFEIPKIWQLLKDVSLHDWQRECIDKWFASDKRGVVKVVTGAGKTIMALGLAERLQNNVDSELRIAVVVPTIVLMNQWYDSFQRYSNLPSSMIGRLGSGYDDALQGDKRILIAVLASASKLLGKNIADDARKHLLLIVDECHRAGASQMSQVFQVSRAYSLGLSATPEREVIQSVADDEKTSDEDSEIIVSSSFDETILGRELGPIIYELNFSAAIERRILPKFEIRHYGLPLASDEAAEYNRLSREITELRESLQRSSKSASKLDGGALVGWARKVAVNQKSKFASSAAQYVQKTTSRKLMLYHSKARRAAVIQLLRNELARNPRSKAILFHESIHEVMTMFNDLRQDGFDVVAENSQLSDSLRVESIEQFRKDAANILVSARSLIEGFDVPSADVGIVVASSSSVRQRIQTLGRILRKHKGDMGEEKHAVLHVLYMAGTTDEMIYEKNNWGDTIGAERNLYFLWDPEVEGSLVAQDGPPRSPLPKEQEIDLALLKPGDIYPGNYEGNEYSCDSQRNIVDSEKRLVQNPQDVQDLLVGHMVYTGAFKVTRSKQAILGRKQINGEWRTIFLGVLGEPFHVQSAGKTAELVVDISMLKPGDVYNGPVEEREEYSILHRSDRFRIVKKVDRNEVYARFSDRANDPEKGRDADHIIAAIMSLERQHGQQINKVRVNGQNDVICLISNKAYFLHRLSRGLEFP